MLGQPIVAPGHGRRECAYSSRMVFHSSEPLPSHPRGRCWPQRSSPDRQVRPPDAHDLESSFRSARIYRANLEFDPCHASVTVRHFFRVEAGCIPSGCFYPGTTKEIALYGSRGLEELAPRRVRLFVLLLASGRQQPKAPSAESSGTRAARCCLASRWKPAPGSHRKESIGRQRRGGRYRSSISAPDLSCVFSLRGQFVPA